MDGCKEKPILIKNECSQQEILESVVAHLKGRLENEDIGEKLSLMTMNIAFE